MKKLLIVILTILLISAITATAFAFVKNSPAQIASDVTGKTIEQIMETKFETGKTYGQICYDENSWEEFRNEMLKYKKEFLDEKVKEGILTKEEADEIYGNIEESQEYCTENGTFGIRNGRANGSGIMGNSAGGNGFGMMKFKNNVNGYGAGYGCRLRNNY